MESFNLIAAESEQRIRIDPPQILITPIKSSLLRILLAPNDPFTNCIKPVLHGIQLLLILQAQGPETFRIANLRWLYDIKLVRRQLKLCPV